MGYYICCYCHGLWQTAAGVGTLINGTNTSITYFKPGKKAGRYQARMDLNDGCQTQQFNFYIDTTCPTLKQYISIQEPIRRVARWSRQLGCPSKGKCAINDRTVAAPRHGGQFRRQDIHGLVGAAYLGFRDNLQYEWEMLEAPNCRGREKDKLCKESRWGFFAGRP